MAFIGLHLNFANMLTEDHYKFCQLLGTAARCNPESFNERRFRMLHDEPLKFLIGNIAGASISENDEHDIEYEGAEGFVETISLKRQTQIFQRVKKTGFGLTIPRSIQLRNVQSRTNEKREPSKFTSDWLVAFQPEPLIVGAIRRRNLIGHITAAGDQDHVKLTNNQWDYLFTYNSWGIELPEIDPSTQNSAFLLGYNTLLGHLTAPGQAFLDSKTPVHQDRCALMNFVSTAKGLFMFVGFIIDLWQIGVEQDAREQNDRVSSLDRVELDQWGDDRFDLETFLSVKWEKFKASDWGIAGGYVVTWFKKKLMPL